MHTYICEPTYTYMTPTPPQHTARDWGYLVLLYLILVVARFAVVALFYPVLRRGDYGACICNTYIYIYICMCVFCFVFI